MAKNWAYNEKDLTLTRNYYTKDENGDSVEACQGLVIDLDQLFPTFGEFDEVQQNVVINGMKQKLDDAIARSKNMALSEPEKREVQEALATRILLERKWNMEGKAGGPRGPSVGLKVSVQPLYDMFTEKFGLSEEEAIQKIADTFKKSPEQIQEFIN